MHLVNVTLDDGRKFEARVDGRDIRAWEAAERKSFLTSDFSYSALTELARLALVRARELDMVRAEFDARCVDVTEVPDTSADPT